MGSMTLTWCDRCGAENVPLAHMHFITANMGDAIEADLCDQCDESTRRLLEGDLKRGFHTHMLRRPSVFDELAAH